MCSLAFTACTGSGEPGEDQLRVREAALAADGSEVESGALPPGEEDATVSFWATCRPFKYYAVRSNGSISEAYSDSCRRRNGTWGGPTYWAGTCWSDLTNCNGALRCGGC